MVTGLKKVTTTATVGQVVLVLVMIIVAVAGAQGKGASDSEQPRSTTATTTTPTTPGGYCLLSHRAFVQKTQQNVPLYQHSAQKRGWMMMGVEEIEDGAGEDDEKGSDADELLLRKGEGGGGDSDSDEEEAAAYAFASFVQQLEAWQKKHEAVEMAVFQSQGRVDRFSSAVKGRRQIAPPSKDGPCSVRVLEAKRVLDGMATEARSRNNKAPNLYSITL